MPEGSLVFSLNPKLPLLNVHAFMLFLLAWLVSLPLNSGLGGGLKFIQPPWKLLLARSKMMSYAVFHSRNKALF